MQQLSLNLKIGECYKQWFMLELNKYVITVSIMILYLDQKKGLNAQLDRI